MSPIRPPAWMQREARAAVGPRLGAALPAGGTGTALTRPQDLQRESRRIAGGLVGLGAIAVLLLNIGIYQSARNLLLTQRWDELVKETNERRQAVRDHIREFEKHARFLTEQAQMRHWAVPAGRAPDPAARVQLAGELELAARSFGFHSIAVFSARGTRIAGTALAPRSASLPGALEEDARLQRGAFGGFRRVDEGAPLLTLALPIQNPGQRGPLAVALFEIEANETIGAVANDRTAFDAATGVYLVVKSGHDVVVLSGVPGLPAGARAGLTDPHARAAAMAAVGLESNVEWQDDHGRQRVAVTRSLPELGWGLVGEMDRAAMTAALRGTVGGLLTLDLALAVLGLVALWLWRRQFATGLAQREMEITRRHGERAQAVFDTAFDAILTFDVTGCVRSVNRAAERLFAQPASEIAGLPLHRFLEWGAPGRASTDLPVPGAVCRAEVRREGGASLPVEFSIGTSGEGEDMLYTAIVRDISGRVEAERQIRVFAAGLENSNQRLEDANAQLEAASQLKSEFLANTSHELRTPLNGMIGFLQLVLDGMCDSPEEERDFLKQALHCSRHLLGLINDVLDIAKIEAGKLTLDVQRVELQAVFDEVYTLTHVQAAQKGLELRFETHPNPPLPARGDAGKIKQVLVNLVGNSLKFTPRGSIVVRATAQPELGHIMFEVADTGIGIPRDRQQMIFEKFTQADGSTTRKYGGTGLGLAITRSLVELMGGVIGVRSEGEGQGTRLFFSLPIWRDGEDAQPADTGTQPERIAGPVGGALVLVVEDDPAFRKYLSALLQASGYRTVEAVNAEAGWMLACRLMPAVVITDYAMTCAENAIMRTGWDLAQRMSGDAHTRHIPIVFVTGFDEELRSKLKATAFARRPEHLMKPVDGPALVARIEQLVGSVQGRPVRVLMVDDDPTVGAFVRKVLPQDRFHVEMATDGEQCLHILRTQPRGFDVMLLDLMMPEVSGYDVLREMTLNDLSAELPVLVLTNYPEPRNEDERRLLELGLVLDVLPKTSVHDNPGLLPHIIGWHLGSAEEEAQAPPAEPRREAA